MEKLFFSDAETVLRILVAVPVMYVAVVAMVRVSGKRTTSQMNGFDWIVTVAMGSLVASGIVSRSTPLFDAILAIGLLLALQYALTRTLRRSASLARVVKAEPRLLVRDGRFLPRALASERMTEGEVMSAVRGAGVGSLQEVAAVVLETDGKISVLRREASAEGGRIAALDGITGAVEPAGESRRASA